MASEALKIVGRVIDRGSQVGIPNARVEAWDSRQAFKDVIGQAVTDHNDAFRMAFDQSFFDAVIPTASPELFFKILVADRLLASTEKDIVWTPDYGDREVVIGVDASCGAIDARRTTSFATTPSTQRKREPDCRTTARAAESSIRRWVRRASGTSMPFERSCSPRGSPTAHSAGFEPATNLLR
jgi:hypothetical protein